MLTESQSNLHHPLGFLFLLQPFLVLGFWTGVVIELWILRFRLQKRNHAGFDCCCCCCFCVETEVNMDYPWLFSQDDTSVSWRCHKKHFFILSNAGKPIYSRSVISLLLPVAVEGHRTLVWLLLLFKLLPSLFSFFLGVDLLFSFLFLLHSSISFPV
jgi:hypothetical protein